MIRRLRRELQAFRPQVLQSFLFHANMAGRWTARRVGVPIVVSGVRVAEQDAMWRMRLDRWTNRLVTHNVCVSESVANVCRALGIAADKVSVIPNGVDVAAFATATPASREEFGIPPTARVLLAVGRLHPQKGFDLLLEAVTPILVNDATLHLVIVGEGPQRDVLERKIAESAHTARVRLIGRRSDVPDLMRASDLFVLSSRWEGMPNVVLEAMAAGLPVVATDVEGVREVIDDGVSGVIVAPESVASLSAGITRVLADERFGDALGQAAQERVRTEFTWEQAARRYCELWNRLLANRE